MDKVFLGGSCNPTTWRKDIVIPLLEEAGISYYNPQVDDWSPELVQIEAKEKEEAFFIIFVIDSETRAIAPILEATEYIVEAEKQVYIVVNDIPDGQVIGGQTITGSELKDLNRARSYLRDLIIRHNDGNIYKDVASIIPDLTKDYFYLENKRKAYFADQEK